MADPKNPLSRILSRLTDAADRPGLVKASVHQTEGYLRGVQGLAWEKPAERAPESDDLAALFLRDVRRGAVALRGRIKDDARGDLAEFLRGLGETFPAASDKRFSGAVARLWVRWKNRHPDLSTQTGRRVGLLLKDEYEEGLAGELSPYLLDDRLHLRAIGDYLRMRGWLLGTIERMKRRDDWEGRESARILEGNFSSIVLRALHNADVGYAATVVATLPGMISGLDRAIARATDPEAAHLLRKNRSTILSHALHSGYLDAPERAAKKLPATLEGHHRRIAAMELESPDAAREMRDGIPALIYRAFTNGKLSS